MSHAAASWRAAAAKLEEAQAAYEENPEDAAAYKARQEALEGLAAAHEEVTERRVELASTPQGESELEAVKVPPDQEHGKQSILAQGRALRKRNKLVNLGMSREDADAVKDDDLDGAVELQTELRRTAVKQQQDEDVAAMKSFVDSTDKQTIPASLGGRVAPARTLQTGDVLSNGFLVEKTGYSPNKGKVAVHGSYPPKKGRERASRRYEWNKSTEVTVAYNAQQAMAAANKDAAENDAADAAWEREAFMPEEAAAAEEDYRVTA